MPTLTVTANGQLTLRKELLAHLGVSNGERLLVEARPDGRLEIRADRATGSISDVFEILKDDKGPRLAIENGRDRRGSWAGKR